MATPALDQATLQRTRDTLGKIIKKPPLTDKLLSRPPFRYLHDIISEVNKATGFFHGLYSGAELDAKAIQDKDAKLAFIQKAIDVLSFVQGDVVRVRSSKIIAGQEVERTNEFLQLLSIAILKKLDSTDAVQRVLRGEKPANKEKKKKGGKKTDGGGSDRDKRERAEGRGDDRERERPIDAKGRSRDRSKERREKGKERQKDEPKKETEAKQMVEEAGEIKVRKSRDVNISDVREGRREGESGEDEGLGSETRLDRPRSAKGHRHRRVVETGEREIESEAVGEGDVQQQQPSHNSPSPPPPITNTQTQPPPMGLVAGKRPGSARPAPPRVVQHTSNDDLTSRISMEMSVAPPTVILDTAGNPDDDHDNDGMIEEDEDKEYMVGNSAPLPPRNTNILQSTHDEQQEPEGALTKTIVATKERLEAGQGEKGDGGTTTITITPAQRKREMEIVKKEMDKLREDIQLLCRYTNPMGRVMDYLQEDTDTMVQELEKWRAENDSNRDNLRREESITENELAPLKSQLEEIDLHIHEQRDKISSLKASIIRQDNSIRQILTSIIPHNK